MIGRQDAETEVSELAGGVCEALLAVPGQKPGEVLFCYLRCRNTWHRFFLDEGVLFWVEVPEPDPEDDLLEGETYVDVGSQAGLRGKRIKRIAMSRGVLRLEFDDGPSIRIRWEDDGSVLDVL
jgi:hypothetical protein